MELNKEELELVNVLLNNEGDFQEGFVNDLKSTWRMAGLLSTFFSTHMRAQPALPEAQAMNVVQFMYRVHPIPRLKVWAGLMNHSATLRTIAKYMESLMIGTAIPCEDPNRDCPSPQWNRSVITEEEVTILNSYMNTPPEQINEWLRKHGFID